MTDETIFYIVGCILAASAVVVTFAGLKLKNFPGRALPLVVLWFVVLAGGAATYSVLLSKEHEEAHAAEHEAGHAEGAESGPYENEGGALGGESEELEDEAEEEAEGTEGTQEEEPVGPTEGPREGRGEEGATGASSGGEASTTTLQLAADETALLFDKDELSAKAGKVTIDFDNPSAIPHNVVIEEEGKELAGFEPISESKKSLSTDLEAGSYEYVCTVPGHEEAGMKGTLTVE